jgi:hypothetical protein
LDPKIEKLIAGLPPEKCLITLQVRDIFLAADKKITESIRWGQLTFSYKGDIAFIYSLKNSEYMNLGFMKAVQLKDPKKLFEGTGKGMRHVKLYSEKDINARQIKAWIKEAVKLNETAYKGKETMKLKSQTSKSNVQGSKSKKTKS